MKPLSVIAIAIAAFLIFLGISSRSTAGGVLSNAVIVGGALVAAVVVGSWIAMYFKNRQQ